MANRPTASVTPKRPVFQCCPVEGRDDSGKLIIGEPVSQRTEKNAADADRNILNVMSEHKRYIVREYWQ
jgi:hypothetical protein